MKKIKITISKGDFWFYGIITVIILSAGFYAQYEDYREREERYYDTMSKRMVKVFYDELIKLPEKQQVEISYYLFKIDRQPLFIEKYKREGEINSEEQYFMAMTAILEFCFKKGELNNQRFESCLKECRQLWESCLY